MHQIDGNEDKMIIVITLLPLNPSANQVKDLIISRISKPLLQPDSY